MRTWLLGLLTAVVPAAHASDVLVMTNDAPTVIVVTGAAGEKEFGEEFERWTGLWEKACQTAKAQLISIGAGATVSTNDLEQLKSTLANEPKDSVKELWLVFLGHGTFDGQEAKFNLHGPDLSVNEMVEMLQPFTRPLAIIDTASASAPFLKKLSGKGRVIVTATRSGYEQNYARFGGYFSAAITNPQADLDKDDQVSLLEAFLQAAHDVGEFYKTAGRLSTEHPLIDDNGDGLGTPPDWFRGIRAVKKPAEGSSLDGLRAHQFHLLRSEVERHLSANIRLKRNDLEVSIMQLREFKEKLPADEYYGRLEVLLLELARLYQASDATPPSE